MPIASQIKSLGHAVSFRVGVSAAVARFQSCARIIMYHGILGRDRDPFVAQLQYFQRHFQIVPLDDVVNALESRCLPDRNEIVLTFDDGLRNNFDVAYPILKELQIPATFFVCPGLIDAGRWLWTHEARSRLNFLDKANLLPLAGELHAGLAGVENVVEWMKTLAPRDRNRAEVKIRQATPEFRPTAEQHAAYDVMSWDELRLLDPELITIGSHTMGHPILPMLDKDQVEVEVSQSRSELESRLGRQADYFAYPNGSIDRQSWGAARKMYRAAVSAETGFLTQRWPADLHRLPRIAATSDLAKMAWRLHRPAA